MERKVFVQNRNGKPLMPTTPRQARHLLTQGKASIKLRDPFFTIQLRYGSSGYKQNVDLGMDAGYQKVGFSAVSEKEELLCGEIFSRWSSNCRRSGRWRDKLNLGGGPTVWPDDAVARRGECRDAGLDPGW